MWKRQEREKEKETELHRIHPQKLCNLDKECDKHHDGPTGIAFGMDREA